MSRVERKKQASQTSKEEKNNIKDTVDSLKNKIKDKWNAFVVWFKGQEKWKQTLIVAGTTIVTLLLILVIVAVSLFNSLFGDMFKDSPEDYDLSLTAVDGYYNILLLGVDTRDMKNLEGTRSDAIMVVSISEDTSDVKILSVYRDTYLKMGETPTYDKITHACVYGGPEMTMKSLNQAMDLNISNYVVVNFKVVADLVDAVGGIEVNIEDYEIEELNKYTAETANNIGYSGYNLVQSPGVQTLDGCQAVSYSRIRKGVGDDFKRTERMRTVVTLTMEKMKDMSFRDIKKIIKTITPQVQTNLSKGNVLGLAVRLPQYNILHTQGWPYTVTTGYIGGISYVFPSNLTDNVIKMHEDFFGQTGYTPSLEATNINDTILANLDAERQAGTIEGEEQQELNVSVPIIVPEEETSEETSDDTNDDTNTEGEATDEDVTSEDEGDEDTAGDGDVNNETTDENVSDSENPSDSESSTDQENNSSGQENVETESPESENPETESPEGESEEDVSTEDTSSENQ